jgi:putative transposase
VTLRLRRGLPSLRVPAAHHVLLGALAAGSCRFGLNVVHYAALSNHIHLLCEAKDASALALGMNALKTRIARRLNRHWGRKGSVFADRFHCRELSSPRECHIALAYVLGNAQRHGIHHANGIDPCSSAAWFEGWDHPIGSLAPAEWAIPLPRAKTWLLREGFEIHGSLPRAVRRRSDIGGPKTRRPKKTLNKPVLLAPGQIEHLNEQPGRKVRDRDSELAVVREKLGRERGRYDQGSTSR